MAKKSNVHPDYYKTAGREPVGQNTVHKDHKRDFASAAKMESGGRPRRGGRRQQPPLTSGVKRKTDRTAKSAKSRKFGGTHETQHPSESG